jgi:hypothetical protein
MAGWGRRSYRESGRRMSRPVGCLLWLVALLVILVVAAVLFGGFQKGTKASGELRPPGAAAVAQLTGGAT